MFKVSTMEKKTFERKKITQTNDTVWGQAIKRKWENNSRKIEKFFHIISYIFSFKPQLK